MTSKTVDDKRQVMARLPFWFKQMAKDIGSRSVPAKSVGHVLAEMFGENLKEQHAKLPKLGVAASSRRSK